jgi:hypothetical protein
MKQLATVALMLNLGVASLYAQQRPVKSRIRTGRLIENPERRLTRI